MDSTPHMEWEKTISGSIPKPTLDDLDKFVKLRLLHKPFTMPPASPSYAAAPSRLSRNIPSLPPPSQPAPPSPFPQLGGPPKRRTPMKCVACEEAHLLMRCNTFAGFDVEQRNKLVREKHLCLNCFFRAPRMQELPKPITCKSCGSKLLNILFPMPNSYFKVSIILYDSNKTFQQLKHKCILVH